MAPKNYVVGRQGDEFVLTEGKTIHISNREIARFVTDLKIGHASGRFRDGWISTQTPFDDPISRAEHCSLSPEEFVDFWQLYHQSRLS